MPADQDSERHAAPQEPDATVEAAQHTLASIERLKTSTEAMMIATNTGGNFTRDFTR